MKTVKPYKGAERRKGEPCRRKVNDLDCVHMRRVETRGRRSTDKMPYDALPEVNGA